MRIIYSEPELKDVVEGILGKSFYLFATGVVSRTIITSRRPPSTLSNLTITVKPHREKITGLARKNKKDRRRRPKDQIVHYIQDTPEENEISLIHEVLHLLEPKWSEAKVEKKG